MAAAAGGGIGRHRAAAAAVVVVAVTALSAAVISIQLSGVARAAWRPAGNLPGRAGAGPARTPHGAHYLQTGAGSRDRAGASPDGTGDRAETGRGRGRRRRRAIGHGGKRGDRPGAHTVASPVAGADTTVTGCDGM